MRHVPEDELHPYLDQALSRSQCVEIETHLAQCAHCRDRRDTIAALRDRTTALLGQLTPRNLIIPPPFEALAERLARQPVTPLWQIRLKRAGLWAAGVMAAVGTGWAGRSLLDPHQPAATSLQEEMAPRLSTAVPLAAQPSPASDSTPAGTPADFAAPTTPITLPAAPRSAAPARRTERRLASVAPAAVLPEPLLQLASMPSTLSEVTRNVTVAAREMPAAPFGPLWQQVQWEDALEKVGSGLPYIEGLLVVGVLLRQGEPGERPIALVAQQDPSGEIITSIEGPAAQVSALLKSQATPESHASEWTRTPPDYVPLAGGGTRRIHRVLTVTGRMSVDSLNALARIATIR